MTQDEFQNLLYKILKDLEPKQEETRPGRLQKYLEINDLASAWDGISDPDPAHVALFNKILAHIKTSQTEQVEATVRILIKLFELGLIRQPLDF